MSSTPKQTNSQNRDEEGGEGKLKRESWRAAAVQYVPKNKTFTGTEAAVMLWDEHRNKTEKGVERIENK